jgi:GDPmannose 4,6-dehydratase
MAKKALIYGINGQDGHYLLDFLIKKGYEVRGVARSESQKYSKCKIYIADLSGDKHEYIFPISDFTPDEIYNLAGVSGYKEAEDNARITSAVNSFAPSAMLEEISSMRTPARFFQASSAYIFEGCSGEVNENTTPFPLGDYAKTKLEAHLSVQNFRKNGLFACNGILFNHESHLRKETFVTRKISIAAAKAKLGIKSGPLVLGNLDAKRDWGFAGDYVEAMWLMLQAEFPDDYIIATGKLHSVREFCEAAFSYVGVDWANIVKIDNSLFRSREMSVIADPSKAKRQLGWSPKVGFKELVKKMVDEDIFNLKNRGV